MERLWGTLQKKKKPKAKAKSGARAASTVDPNKSVHVLALAKTTKEMISEVNVKEFQLEKYWLTAEAEKDNDAKEWSWATEFLVQWKNIKKAMSVSTGKLGAFYGEFKAGATSAKQVLLLKKQYKDLRPRCGGVSLPEVSQES